jgi:PAS domain S-box-containing protein
MDTTENRFHVMAQASDVLIATSDTTSNATYFNTKWTELTGRSLEDLLQFGWADLIHEDDRQPFVDLYLAAFELQAPWKGGFKMLAADGSYRNLVASGSPVFDSQNSFSGYISSTLDMTDTFDAFKDVATSEQTLRSMVENSPIGICILDAATLVTEVVNDSFIEVAGKTYDEISGHFYWDTFAEARSYYEEALHSVVETGIAFYANEVALMLIRHGKEETIFVTFVYSPLFGTNGKVNKVAVWVLENTTQVVARQEIEQLIKKRTADLAEANSNLQKSNSDLAQFAHIASHDLQEPLRKIRTYGSRLEKIINPADTEARAYMVKINDSAARMSNLITDILTYAEFSEGGVLVPIDLNVIIDEICIDFEVAVAEKDATIHYQHLPTIRGIRLQIGQLFTNLISNSLKFIKPGTSPNITIASFACTDAERAAMGLSAQATYHKIVVSDNGIGIDPNYTEQIFQIFKRLHGKLEFGGTGIGLAMCKRVMTNHHGEITAAGSDMNGARFEMYFPVDGSL